MNEQLDFKYASTIRAGLRSYAAWPFGTTLKVADYGTLTGDLFVKRGNSNISEMSPFRSQTKLLPPLSSTTARKGSRLLTFA